MVLVFTPARPACMRTRVPRDDEYIECIEFSVSTTTTTTFGAEALFSARAVGRLDFELGREETGARTKNREQGRRGGRKRGGGGV